MFMKRSGVLMPIFSLPSPYGIGTVGRGAYEFADYIKKSGAEIWQVLPVGPTGYGNSPYQSFSSFAGNPYFIDPDMLCEDGILERNDLPERVPEGENIDYGRIYFSRRRMLRAAYDFSGERLKSETEEFLSLHPDVYDYAFFMSLKDRFGGKCYLDFPKCLVRRERAAMKRYEELLSDDISYYIFEQYLFFSQWKRFKEYVNSLGIELLGDMPIYVAPDSADVWANPRSFQLDRDRRPKFVAGVPPDYFSENGQKWGNPLYDWKRMKNRGYGFFIRRAKAAAELFDSVRLDHFIGFANYYSVEPQVPDAKNGFWRDGPGKSLFSTLEKEVPSLGVVAEDLGIVSDKVIKLLKSTGYPSMRVIQFAFDDNGTNMHLPKNVRKNTYYYTGTHDNPTTHSWWLLRSEEGRLRTAEYLGKKRIKAPETFIKAVLDSRAEVAVIPIWDILSLGDEGRVNTPGTSEGNWLPRLGKIPEEPAKLARK